MEHPVRKLLSTITLGKSQTRRGMTVIPVRQPEAAGPVYLSLREAMDKGKLQITEIAESGSVPELKVANGYDCAVLLLDGEELVGAKQNRVLNTTVLLKEHSTTVIPVSCTEQGRWSYSRPDFTDAGVVMPPRLRQQKTRSVSDSLRANNGHRSDQGLIWREIESLSERTGVMSPTSAMHDVYAARMKALATIQKSFTCVPGQMGLIVLHAGKIVGFDYVSRPAVFAQLFPKLIQSYAMDALASESKGRTAGTLKTAKDFMAQVAKLSSTEHPSVGYGTDLRFSGDNLVGSALAVDSHVIHAAFFASEAQEERGDRRLMAGSNRRRRYREL